MKAKEMREHIRVCVGVIEGDFGKGYWPSMKHQCGMDAEFAVAWQVAMLLKRKRKLLTLNQTKLNKAVAEKTGYVNIGLTLAPAHEATPFLWKEYTACDGATKACIGACVGAKTGHGKLPSHKIARIGKTLLMELYPSEFREIFHEEIMKEYLRVSKKGYKLACRFNIASDHWRMADEMAERYRDVHFYDYTAVTSAMRVNRSARFGRALDAIPISHSRVRRVYSRKDGRDDLTLKMLKEGYGVAVVFDVSARKKEPLPKTWHGYQVIDGDVHDLWFLRAHPGCAFVVGLRVKGSNKQIESCRESGFATELRR